MKLIKKSHRCTLVTTTQVHDILDNFDFKYLVEISTLVRLFTLANCT